MRTNLPVIDNPEQLYAELGLRPELPKWDNSFLSNLLRCQRLSYWNNILGRRPERSVALAYGGTWHAMHESFGKTGSLDVAFQVADEMLPEEMDDRYGRSRSKIKQVFEWHVNEKWVSMNERMELVYQEQPFDVYCPVGMPCVFGEYGCGLHHGGKIDRVYRFMDKLWLLDFKTSTHKDDYISDKIQIDSQLLGYSWAVSHLHGERVWGVIIDRTVSNKSTTDSQRYPIAIGSGVILDWVRDMQNAQARARELFDNFAFDQGGWTKNSDECFKYGKCPWYSVCTIGDPESRLKYLAANFPESRWDFMKA